MTGHDAATGEVLTFKHPAVQSAFMFLGEGRPPARLLACAALDTRASALSLPPLRPSPSLKPSVTC